ncbi:unnamed protein product, partial [Pylaiella littoralis]
EGPLTCLECAGALVRKQGKIRVLHFAHHLMSPDCSGGGESALYKEKFGNREVLFAPHFQGQVCYRKAMIPRKHADSSAQQEYRCDANKSYSADVAIFQNGAITSIVEVSHATTGESLKSRTARIGANNVCRISAIDILNQQ